MTLAELRADAAARLSAGPHPGRARADADLLLLHVLGPEFGRARLLTRLDQPAAPGQQAALEALLARRLRGEPVQYITGRAHFFGLELEVSPAVLIPRPETELLVEAALERLPASGPELSVADVGTGSGAIAVAVAAGRENVTVTATDLSPAALAVAARNAARHGVGARVRLLTADLLEPFPAEAFDMILANLPYIPERDRAGLDVEVREFEPAAALFAGEDGLEGYRRLLPQARRALRPGGWLLLEFGCGQQPAVAALLAHPGWQGVRFEADLQQIPRLAAAQKRAP